jgi:hypothetical protein
LEIAKSGGEEPPAVIAQLVGEFVAAIVATVDPTERGVLTFTV